MTDEVTDNWMIAIDFEHSNSGVRDDIRPTSTRSDNPY
jgi:hypothetical protein